MTIESLGTNTGNIFVAEEEAKATAADGHVLEPGDQLVVTADRFSHVDARVLVHELWIDSAVTSEGVEVRYMEVGNHIG